MQASVVLPSGKHCHEVYPHVTDWGSSREAGHLLNPSFSARQCCILWKYVPGSQHQTQPTTQVAEQFGPHLVWHWQIRTPFAIFEPALAHILVCHMRSSVSGRRRADICKASFEVVRSLTALSACVLRVSDWHTFLC